MGYIICEECGGYYELQSGEFADDFENCQCGGNLKLVEDSFLKSGPENNTRFVCSNCLEENEAGLYCSNCGGRLISINNKNNETKSGSSYDMDHIERLARNSKNASGNYKNNYSNNEIDSYNEPKDILERISWLGVIVGVLFFVITAIITVLGLVLIVFGEYGSGSVFVYYSPGILLSAVIYILLLIIIAIISGALASLISKSRDFKDGALNGGLVGVIFSLLLGIIGGSLSGLFIGIFFYGGLAAFGGALGVFLRRKLDK
ncbi:MAG: hypothetical protein Q8N97_09630 [Methanobacteriaceae archaeon]|nr:hypothetical protein [Methanobacteriaceae archaeon]MDP3623724.1 hypothetical protein [Methanobacteriaceae archaeon]